MAIKNKDIEVTPITPLKTSSFLCVPKMGIFLWISILKVKNNVPIDLKKTNSNVWYSVRYFKITFIQAKATVLNTI